MAENDKTEEFLQQLAPCIQRGELDACVEEAARLADEIEIGVNDLLELSSQMGRDEKYELAYVLALVAVEGLDDSGKPTAYSNAGLAAQSLGDAGLAEEQYKKAIESNPNYAAAHNGYANLLDELDKKGEAEEHYKKAIEADPNYAVAHNNYAILLEEFGKKDEAEEHYKKAIEADPNSALAHYNYANLLDELDKKDEAEEHYKKAIEADPNYAAAHNNYANLLDELDKKDEAEEHYKKAIEADPNSALAYSNYAILLEEFGKKDEAEEHYKKAIEADSNYAIAHYNYAILLKEFDKKDEAEEHYKKAIEFDPNDVAAHNNYANLLEEFGKKDEAEGHYKKAIESDPNYALAHSNYANLLRERRKFYDAEKEIRIALQIAQADPSEQHVLPYAHGTLGDILADEDYYENAVKEYEKSLNLLEGSHSEDISFISEMHNNLGWAYIQLKISKKARDEFRSACALDPMNVKAIRNLRALGKVGSESGVSKIQIYLSIMLLLPFIVSYYLFFIEKLSETLFVTQSVFFIALVIFVVLYPELSKVKIGAIEFEKSTEFRSMEAKSRAMERMSEIER